MKIRAAAREPIVSLGSTPPLVKYCTLRTKEGLKVPASGKLYTAPFIAGLRTG